MQRKLPYILLIALGSLFFIQGRAQTSMLSIGVRGGGQTYLPDAALGASGEVKTAFGGAGTLDLRYTFYGNITDRLGIGFALGAGVGYGTAGVKGTNTDTYTNFDYLGNQMDYTTSAEFKQTDRFARAEASLMAALRFGNVTLNIGPRFMLPFAASSSLTLSEASIDAYYPRYNVHVVNELITGRLETPITNNQSPITNYQYSILLAAELGYEWHLNDKSSLGLQAYIDVGVWNNQSPITNNQSPLIAVSPITDAATPVPEVTVGSIEPLIADCRYLSFGVRAYYAFSVEKKASYERRTIHSRDTRLHRNRYKWY